MPVFFSKFPLIRYDLENRKYPYQNSQVVTNITFRIGIIREVLNNTSSYFEYVVREGEKPEILADKFYDNPEAHWIILYANDIYDPQYDWPMDYLPFQKYIANKYRTPASASLGHTATDVEVISWTKVTAHHYEKIITKVNSSSQVTDEQRIEIDYDDQWTTAGITVPYDTYLNLPSQTVEVFNLSGTTAANNIGATITQTTTKGMISLYDYEESENEKKRNIKVIKKRYYNQIINEFSELTNSKNYTRRLV